ncbi:glycerol_3_P DHase A [Enterospora canceri]|uniref:Glycerol-3-phosphate dehydrogenase n=1 Tax=Enterospora canceri TaxID=1081671 RepID=A0A1Y1S9E3_9MICR|nr:glycerol_3_P DHase A [Enterospora canceri]
MRQYMSPNVKQFDKILRLETGMFLNLAVLVVMLVIYLVRKRRVAKERRAAQRERYEMDFTPSTRGGSIKQAKTGYFDVVVIGGGSTGVGVALDGATRGLRVCLVEQGDLACSTSSKSTKLLHGGVRYLDKAVRKMSISQLRLVIEALYERKAIMEIAPYLSQTIRMFVPLYSNLQTVFYFCLLKLYDWLAGSRSLGRSYFVGQEQAKMYNFHFREKNLTGAMVYYDGSMDDSRLNVMLGVTAAFHGATVLNHVKFISFDSNQGQMICVDRLTKRKFSIRTRTVVNATGSYTDITRRKTGKQSNMMVHSTGSHICIDSKFGPVGMGLVDKCTVDGRMLFVVPWMGFLVAGATERVVQHPSAVLPTKDDLDFIVAEINKFTSTKLCHEDVKSIWTGVRPLVQDSGSNNSENLVRSFKIIDDKNKVVSVTGGKWTTYRTAAKETIDFLVKNYKLKASRSCVTEDIRIVGSTGYSRNMFYRIAEWHEIDLSYAKHLQQTYGAYSFKLAEYLKKHRSRILVEYEHTYAEVLYVMRHEYAITLGDIVNRRFRIGFINVRDAERMAIKIREFLVLNNIWSNTTARKYSNMFYAELDEFGWSILNNPLYFIHLILISSKFV